MSDVDPEHCVSRSAVRPIVLSVSKNHEFWRYRNTVLSGLGVGICPATSVSEALARLGRMRIAVVVLGESIPEAEKADFLRQAKSICEVPTICIQSENDSFCDADCCIAAADSASLIGAVANFTSGIR